MDASQSPGGFGPPTPSERETPAPTVTAHVTYTYGQLLITTVEASRALAVAVLAFPVLAVLSFVTGDASRGVIFTIISAVIPGLLLRSIRKAFARLTSTEWTIDAHGLRIVSSTTDARLAWSQVQRILGSRSTVFFRTPTAIPLPRRCITSGDLETIRALAQEAGVDVKGVVRRGD